jgi:SAM-dependent methyltransferase
VWRVARKTFRRDDKVLELNCGTGEDALFLARNGVSVYACDASERMIAVANRRLSLGPAGASVQFQILPSEDIAQLSQLAPFDGVFSNFAGLNCVTDLAATARNLFGLLRPGAPALLVLSARVCAWETLWYAAHGDVRRATRRWSGHTTGNIGNATVEVIYPSVRKLKQILAPFFVLRSWRGIGVAVPPSYVERAMQRHRGVFSALRLADEVLARVPGFRAVGDHVLLQFERSAHD